MKKILICIMLFSFISISNTSSLRSNDSPVSEQSLTKQDYINKIKELDTMDEETKNSYINLLNLKEDRLRNMYGFDNYEWIYNRAKKHNELFKTFNAEYGEKLKFIKDNYNKYPLRYQGIIYNKIYNSSWFSSSYNTENYNELINSINEVYSYGNLTEDELKKQKDIALLNSLDFYYNQEELVKKYEEAQDKDEFVKDKVLTNFNRLKSHILSIFLDAIKYKTRNIEKVNELSKELINKEYDNNNGNDTDSLYYILGRFYEIEEEYGILDDEENKITFNEVEKIYNHLSDSNNRYKKSFEDFAERYDIKDNENIKSILKDLNSIKEEIDKLKEELDKNKTYENYIEKDTSLLEIVEKRDKKLEEIKNRLEELYPKLNDFREKGDRYLTDEYLVADNENSNSYKIFKEYKDIIRYRNYDIYNHIYPNSVIFNYSLGRDLNKAPNSTNILSNLLLGVNLNKNKFIISPHLQYDYEKNHDFSLGIGFSFKNLKSFIRYRMTWYNFEDNNKTQDNVELGLKYLHDFNVSKLKITPNVDGLVGFGYSKNVTKSNTDYFNFKTALNAGLEFKYPILENLELYNKISAGFEYVLIGSLYKEFKELNKLYHDIAGVYDISLGLNSRIKDVILYTGFYFKGDVVNKNSVNANLAIRYNF